MRIGVVDIGSNSVQVQIVDVTAGGPPLPAQAVKQPTLLSEATEPDGSISQEGVERVAQAAAVAIQTAVQQQVDEVYLFVTSAIRDALNREAVLDRVEQVAGLRPQFLSGEEEARLTYAAARRWYGWSSGRMLLFDIGGGSMEIVLGRDAEPDLAISLPLGAGRMTRTFLPKDPPTKADLKLLRRHVGDTLGEVADRIRWEGPASHAVATSKTFKQLARLAGAPAQRKGPFVRRRLSRRDVEEWIPRLAGMTAGERARLRGISHSRARQVVAGAVVAQLTMTILDVRTVEICPWALREGIVLRHLEAMAQTPAVPLRAVQPLSPTSGSTEATVTPLKTR